MIVIVGEKVLHHMASDKAAFFVKGDGLGRVPRAKLQGVELAPIFLLKKFQHSTAVAFFLMGRGNCKVFKLQQTFALVRHHAYGAKVVVKEGIHPAAVKIAVDHNLA